MLSERELIEFLDRGYLVLDLDDVPDTVHDTLFHRAEELHAANAKLSNSRIAFDLIADNLHIHAPELQYILRSRTLDSALTSILGEDYYRYEHSFVHKAGVNDHSFHKDSPFPWGTRGGIRSHRPNWAMVFYYPQETSRLNGATEVIPGSQYWNVDREQTGNQAGEDRLDINFDRENVGSSENWKLRDEQLSAQWQSLDPHTPPKSLDVSKGSAVLVHFDLFHRGVRQLEPSPRYLYKFWYVRMREPRTRTRNVRNDLPMYDLTDDRRQSIVPQIHSWLSERETPTRVSSSDVSCESPNLEADRILSAYRRGLQRDVSLLNDFEKGNESEKRSSMYGLTMAGECGKNSALGLLNSLLPTDRCRAIFLLGEISKGEDEVISELVHSARSDESTDVRTNAIIALGRIVRRCLETLSDESVKLVIDAICVAALQSAYLKHRFMPTSNVRQAAFLTLLTIVTCWQDNARNSQFLNGISDVAEHAAESESDRYARSTAIEVLSRLAESGVKESIPPLVKSLRHSRWSHNIPTTAP